MDDATQKLVDEARGELSKVWFGGRQSGRVALATHLGLLRRVTDALEAERAHVQSLAKWVGVPETTPSLEIACEVSAALEAAQHPPVSPEQREAVRAVVGEQLTRAGLDIDGPPFADDGETQWPVALELRDRMTDAILARFTIPVLDVEALPVVAHKGPHDTDESMFLTAADNLDRGYPLGGGNLTRAVVELIRREARRARATGGSGS